MMEVVRGQAAFGRRLAEKGPEIVPYGIVHFPVCESTHTWVLNNSTSLIKEYGLSPTRPLRISTDFQTRGIGQRRSAVDEVVVVSNVNGALLDPPSHPPSHSMEHKTWVSPPGNVLVTFVHAWQQKRIDQVVQLTHVAALAVVNVLKELGLEPKVKWVNDVLVNGRKISGILCNSTGWSLPVDGDTTNELLTAVLISIGLNVSSVPSLDGLDAGEQQLVTCVATELVNRNNQTTSQSKSHQSEVSVTLDHTITMSTAERSFGMSSLRDNEDSNKHCSTESSSFIPPPSLPLSGHDLNKRTTSSLCSSLPNHQTRLFSTVDNQSVLSASSVLNSLSCELYRMINMYESRGFSPIYSALNPMMYGLGQTVTIRNPSIHLPSSAPLLPHSSPHSSNSVNVTQPDELRGQLVGLCPTSGFLMVKLFDHNGDVIVVEIFNGHLTTGLLSL